MTQSCFYHEEERERIADEIIAAMFSTLLVHFQVSPDTDVRELYKHPMKLAGGRFRSRAKAVEIFKFPGVDTLVIPGSGRDLVDLILQDCDRTTIVANGHLPVHYEVDDLYDIATHHVSTVAIAETEARVLLLRAMRNQRVHLNTMGQFCAYPQSSANEETLFNIVRALRRVLYWSDVDETRSDCRRALKIVEKMRRRPKSF